MGVQASSLLELRDKLATVDEGCIYHHFWGGRMNPQFVHPQNHNDFASWVFHHLHDLVLAEKLSIIDPTEFDHLEDLRQELLETIDRRIDDYDAVFWTKKAERFHFINSTIVVFKSSMRIERPEDLAQALSRFPLSSIFYHFIDARSRTQEKTNDFSIWLNMFGDRYQTLSEEIQEIDPYFLSLPQLREELIQVTLHDFKKNEE